MTAHLDFESIEDALVAGADPNARSSWKNQPVTFKDKVLAAFGMGPKVVNSGRSALESAALRDDTDAVRLLLEYGADPNRSDADSDPPILWAGSITCANLLIAAGANVNVRSKLGETALSKAAARSNTALVKLLIKHGANVNNADDGGMTPLMYACESAAVNSLRVLLDSGADTELKDAFGRTAIFHAARSEENPPPDQVGAAIQLLDDHGARLDITMPDGSSVIGRARPEYRPLLRKLASAKKH